MSQTTWRNCFNPKNPNRKVKIHFSTVENLELIDQISRNSALIDPNSALSNEARAALWDTIGMKMNKNEIDTFANPHRWIQHCMLDPACLKRRWIQLDCCMLDPAIAIPRTDCGQRWWKLKMFYETYEESTNKSASAREMYSKLQKLHSSIQARKNNETDAVAGANEACLPSTSNLIPIVKEEDIPFIKEQSSIVNGEEDSESVDSDWLNNVQPDYSINPMFVIGEDENSIVKTEPEVEEVAGDDKGDDVETFTRHMGIVMDNLPPLLRAQAKKEIFDVLTKYEIMNVNVKDKNS